MMFDKKAEIIVPTMFKYNKNEDDKKLNESNFFYDSLRHT